MIRILSYLILFVLLLRQEAIGQERCMADAFRLGLPDRGEAAVADLQQREVVTIPVVVHVVYKNEVENISLEQIYSQLEVLNEDYRAQNGDLELVPDYFEAFIADTEISFCLAARTPEGEWTNGVTRTETSLDNIGMLNMVHYTALGGRDAWDPEYYLNIWVADMGGSVGGRSSFPGQGPAAEDGVVVDPFNFGTVGIAGTSAPYNLGRTTTHEIGHYFNLEHVWGQGSPDCDNSDFVEDTPKSANTYLGECPSGPLFSCSSPDMYNNFMFYTDDACMAHFTPGQKARMWAAIEQYRGSLLDSPGCLPTSVTEPGFVDVEVFPNPTSGRCTVRIPESSVSPLSVAVFDTMGRLVFTEVYLPSEATISVDLQTFGKGIYWVRLSGEAGFAVRRVVYY